MLCGSKPFLSKDTAAMRRTLPILFAALAIAPVLAVNTARAQPAALPTPEFIHTAGATDAFERDAGKLAEHQGKGMKVKMFAHMMVMDHTKTTKGLMHAIKMANLPTPPPPAPTAEQAQMLDTLRPLHGRDFDKAYLDGQIMVHQKALAAMQAYAHGGENPEIRKAAAKTVPIVEHHLMKAQKIEASMK
jgi:putative membrane protein